MTSKWLILSDFVVTGTSVESDIIGTGTSRWSRRYKNYVCRIKRGKIDLEQSREEGMVYLRDGSKDSVRILAMATLWWDHFNQLPGTTEPLSSHHLFSISCLFCPWHSRWFWSLGSLVLVLILTEYKEQLQKKGRLKVENWEQFAYFFSFKRTIYDSIIAKLLQKSCFVFASAHWDTI